MQPSLPSASIVEPETQAARPKPGGLRRAMNRAPALLYRLRLGWLLGRRFLLLTHQGRKSGRIYNTVLGVLSYDAALHESVVVSGYGERADWYRNIQAHPALEIQTGWRRYAPVQRALAPPEVEQVLAAYARHNPRSAALLLRSLGYRADGSPEWRRAVAETLRMVAFRPQWPC